MKVRTAERLRCGECGTRAVRAACGRKIITKKCLKAHLLIQMGGKIKTPAALYESNCQVKVIGKISADMYF